MGPERSETMLLHRL